MRHVPRLSAIGLLALAGGAGCTHNYYYVPSGQLYESAPAVVQYGEVCEVPSSPNRVVVANPAPSRNQQVLVSRPQGGLGSRMAWRRPDPEGLATTRVEGGLDDAALR